MTFILALCVCMCVCTHVSMRIYMHSAQACIIITIFCCFPLSSPHCSPPPLCLCALSCLCTCVHAAPLHKDASITGLSCTLQH